MKTLPFGLAAIVLLSLPARGAHACGGCFQPTYQQSGVSQVSGHRMAVAVSPTRTVLWDQIKFTGSPSDFGWVLPVRPGAFIEAASDDFFTALETWTSERVDSPRLTCPGPGNPSSSPGCACGSSSSASPASATSGGGGAVDMTHHVTVVADKTVGPYEAVTLHTTDGAVLYDWLSAHGFHVPDGIGAIIDAYVAEGADFIALRLRPNQGVQSMRPVRVITLGDAPILPLRMVKAGVGTSVPITLWVFAEQRDTLTDFPELFLDWSKLAWDWQTSTSNYPDILAATLAQNGGRTLATTFATPNAFTGSLTDPSGQPVTIDATGNRFGNSFGAAGSPDAIDNLPALYLHGKCPPNVNAFSSNQLVEDGCPHVDGAGGSAGTGAGTSGSGGGAGAAGGGACGPVASTALLSTSLGCKDHDDLGAVAIGMHPANIWLTRVELNLPVEALTADCTVGASALQMKLSNWAVASVDVNPPCVPQQASITPRSKMFRIPFGGTWLLIGLGALALRRAVRFRGNRASRSA